MNKTKYISIAAGGIIVFAVLVLVFSQTQRTKNTATQPLYTTPLITETVSTEKPSTSVRTSIENTKPTTSPNTQGTYTESVTYKVPKHSETINVSITLEKGVVTKLVTTHSSIDERSKRYHEAFDQGIQQLVVGKKLSDISVSRVSGASGTSTAFMKAVSAIQAKVQ